MVKISFFLVFSIVLALPFRSVIGQDWNELVNQAGLTQQTLDEAKKAIGAANGMAGAAAGQEALNDYLGGSEDVAETGASLADLIDNDGNNIVDAASPSDAVSPSAINIVDPPQDQTSAMVDAQETPDDDPNFTGIPYAEEAPTSSPSESPISEAPGYAAPSKAPAANAPSRAPAAANAPIKTPKLAPTNEAVEAPEDADEVEDEDDPVIVPPPMAAAPELDD